VSSHNRLLFLELQAGQEQRSSDQMSKHVQQIETSDFGQFLASVAERDVDLLLMEEFHASDDFVTWFCLKVGLIDIRCDGAWHSVSDADGETDLLLRVTSNERRVGVFIENKIGAAEQATQDERYHIRATRALAQGKLDAYLTVICAPHRYLSALDPSSNYQQRVSYEDIAAWFHAQPGKRAAWRHHVIQAAIEQSRRGYHVIPHPINTAFHLAYWQYLVRHHPRIVMQKPAIAQGKNSTWIVLKGPDFPRDVQIDHLLHNGVVRLSFFGRTLDSLLAIQPMWPDDVQLIRKPKSVVVSIAVPPVTMDIPFDLQVAAIDEALRAVYRLMPFATLQRAS
jgi:hypothetical protein